MLVGKIDANEELYQYFHDGLGSITMICDSTGSYQNLYTYDDFGDFRKKDEEVSNSYCYTGQERDEEPSGLYNLRARYYAAGMGRFTQEDPIMHLSIRTDALFGTDPEAMFIFGMAQPQGLHGYSYVWNNSVNWIDPFGLCEKDPFDFCAAANATVDIVIGLGTRPEDFLILEALEEDGIIREGVTNPMVLGYMGAFTGLVGTGITGFSIIAAPEGLVLLPGGISLLWVSKTCWQDLYNYYKAKR